MSSNSSLVIPPFAFDGPRERYEPLGKVAKLWEFSKQEGRNPGFDAMPPVPGSGATITPGRQVICGHTHAVCVAALHYHQPPELRQHSPAHSEEPQAATELLTDIMHSHQPHWDDCCQLMSTLFTSDECWRVYQAARAWLVTQAPPQAANPEQWADESIPDTRPAGIQILLPGSNPSSV
jgi:hypothetical protein